MIFEHILKGMTFTPESIMDMVNKEAANSEEISIEDRAKLNRYMQKLAPVMLNHKISREERDNRLKQISEEFHNEIADGANSTK